MSLVDDIREGLAVASRNARTMWDGERSMRASAALDELEASLATAAWPIVQVCRATDDQPACGICGEGAPCEYEAA